jgi:pre-mRNA-splicing factor RBM22/SLT11
VTCFSVPFATHRNGQGQKDYLQTEVCKTCAKLKNCCQSCILDLEFGLPTHIRDAGLAMQGQVDAGKMPVNIANRDWYQQQAEREMAAGRGRWGRDGVERVVASLSALEPQYAASRAHACAFFLRGHCDKGDACPYKHVSPAELLAVAAAAGIRTAGATGAAPPQEPAGPPPPPPDLTITTLYIANVDPQRVTERDLRAKLDAYGELKSIRVIPRKRCAFAEFAVRADAERAVDNLFGRFELGGTQLRIGWSLTGGGSGGSTTTTTTTTTTDQVTAPVGVRRKEAGATDDQAPPPVLGLGGVSFPSQNASQLGFVKKATATEK